MVFRKMTGDERLADIWAKDYPVAWISDCVKVQIFMYPVFSGIRLRAGYQGDAVVYLDWCCGSKPTAFSTIFAMLTTILKFRDANNAFMDLPRDSKVKPYYEDKEFMAKVYLQYKEASLMDKPISFNDR